MLSLLAALLLLHPRVCWAAASFDGLAASPGWRGPVTGRVTFDRKKAAEGGRILAAAALSRKDYDAMRVSEALLATEGGLLSYSASLARELGIPLLVLEQAAWGAEADVPVLILEEPLLGKASRSALGAAYRVVEDSREHRLREDDVVTIDPEQGSLTLYAPEERSSRLAAAEALRAYDGLKDARSLAQWYEGSSEDPAERARLACALEEGLARRLMAGGAGGASPQHFREVRAALKKSPGQERVWRDCENAAWTRHRAHAAGAAKSLETRLKSCGTRQAALGLAQAARSRWDRVSALGEALGRRSAELAPLKRSYERLERLGQARLKELELAGAEGASLESAARAAGARLPPRARLEAGLYRRFIADAGLEAKIARLAEDSSRDLRRKSAEIRALIREAPLAREASLGREIEALLPAAWASLTFSAPSGSAHAVRERWPEALKEVWASLWSPRSLGLRRRERRPLTDEEAEVFAREELRADVSGLVLPASGARLMVSAEPGPAEFSDHYVLDPGGREFLPARLGSSRRLMDAEALASLARLYGALEDHFGAPLELRFCLRGGELYVLQVSRLAEQH